MCPQRNGTEPRQVLIRRRRRRPVAFNNPSEPPRPRLYACFGTPLINLCILLEGVAQASPLKGTNMGTYINNGTYHCLISDLSICRVLFKSYLLPGFEHGTPAMSYLLSFVDHYTR